MLDIMKIRAKMDVGFGVRPEILMYDTSKSNCINFRLSKIFKGEKYSVEVSLLHYEITKTKLSNFVELELEQAIVTLQKSIDEVAKIK